MTLLERARRHEFDARGRPAMGHASDEVVELALEWLRGSITTAAAAAALNKTGAGAHCVLTRALRTARALGKLVIR